MSQMPPVPPIDPGPIQPMQPAPADRVKPPAIAIMVATIIGMVLAVIGILINALGMGLAASQQQSHSQQDILGPLVSSVFGIVQAVIGLIIGVVILIGVTRMMKLQSWGFSLAACIMAMIPCVSPCCLLGLPFGIWGIVVLCDEQVKAAFTR